MMAAIPGSINITGLAAPPDDGDSYPTVDPVWGIGGLREVADATVRDTITIDRRRFGMLVYVQSPGTMYQLLPTNSGSLSDDANWNVFLAGYVKTDGTVAFTGDQSLGSHKLTNVTDPASAQDAATKSYVDAATAALEGKTEAQAATTTALAASTYANGSSGVGATLTLTVAAVLVLDGYTPVLGDRLLIKNQADAVQNGVYTLTTVGVALGAQAVLTRATDFDQPGEVDGALIYVLNGTTYGNTLWVCTTSGTVTFGSTNINWSQFTGSTYTADETTLHLSGTTFSIKSGYLATIATTGAITDATGTLLVTHGGTGKATATAHALQAGNGTSALTDLGVGSNGQLLIGQTSADPAFTTVTGDVTITSGGVTAIGAGKVTPAMTTDLRARLTADVTNSTATMANLTDLSVTLVAGAKYIGRLVLKCNNSVAAEGIKLDFNGGGATTTSFWAAGNQAVGGTVVTGALIATSLSDVIDFSTITGETTIIIAISLVCNAGGTFIPRVAEDSHTSGTLTVELGSSLVLERTPN